MNVPFKIMDRFLSTALSEKIPSHMLTGVHFLRSVLVILALVALVNALFSRSGSKSWIFGLGAMCLYFVLGIGVGITSSLTFLLFLISGALFFLELILPGFGVAGISGILLFLISIALSMGGGAQAAVTFIVAAIIVALMIKNFVQRGDEITLLKPFISNEVAHPQKMLDRSLGEKGVAVTTLRPTGIGEFNGKKLTVQSEGSFIEKGSDVVIVAIRGKSVYVKEVS
ncbi:nodulation efficiency protein D [Aedoeadaptatus nemausensis]|uniref:Nodulation efficiency protein D n=1 Tax=Aedoeadaptatus nemausensis TaxID=2582829 RepID=A0A6V6XYP0_9FIRM|nr:NfeD family protein [Peptoniphilus nemausensis]CAC9922660.1 nodulation efficiency protein D [Peptoniphilus nemausensis]